MVKSCLFIVNGLGLGNSTRCYAVIEKLCARGVAVHVLTSGNGLFFFSDKAGIASVTAMDAFFYSGAGGRVSAWKTLLSLPRLRRLERRKEAQLDRLLGQFRPDAAVIDSEYAVGPLRRRGIPVIGLNNSDVVVSHYLRYMRDRADIRPHFWLVEFMDYLFHRKNCDLVISPTPIAYAPRHPRIRHVGLILRRSVRDMVPPARSGAFALPRDCRQFVFMLSGSIFASDVRFEGRPLPFRADVVGRSGENTAAVTYHGRLLDNTALLRRADALVINGGFCAVSEAIALDKPTFAIPVPGHAEQAVNASMLAQLGAGLAATEMNVLELIAQRVTVNEWKGFQPKRPVTGLDGASEAADLIANFAPEPA